MKPTSARLGHDLRDGTDDFLVHRRIAVALALASMASLGVVVLYQTGVIKHLPEPPLPGLDAEKVNGSPGAYKRLNTPDAVLGLGSYAITLGLVAMGGADRAQKKPWMPLALAAKAGMDAIQAATLTRKSWVNFRAFSFYSLIAMAATSFTLPVVLPEARAAWKCGTCGLGVFDVSGE